MILEATVEIPWLSRDLQTSGTSAAPVLDTGGESFQDCSEETAVSFFWVVVLDCRSAFSSRQATTFGLAILAQ